MEGEDLKNLHRAATRHRQEVEASREVSCFFCLRVSPTSAVTEWTDDGETALCPHCDIDAVLPGYVEPVLLGRMHEYYFLRFAQP
jgi:hypothetical protein